MWTANKTFTVIVLYLILALATQLFFQAHGTRYLDSALVKATAAYALARGLNGVITVAQESSVSAGFVLEGTVAVGQVLDPVNDLIEHFSTVMLISIVSLGIQKLLVVIGVQLGTALFVLALVVLSLAWLANRRRAPSKSGPGLALLALAIVVQTALPISNSVTATVSDLFLARRYAQAERELTDVRQAIDQEFSATGARWFERLDPRRLLDVLVDRAGELTGNVIDLMIIFLFETVLMPLLTLGLLVAGFGYGMIRYLGSSQAAP